MKTVPLKLASNIDRFVTDVFAVSMDDREDPLSVFYAAAKLLDDSIVEMEYLADAVEIRAITVVSIRERWSSLDPFR